MNRLYKFQVLITSLLFFLIVLGAGVRIAHAGLSCPDWPLCFGEFVPPFNTEVFLEWFHRLIAGSIGVLALGASLYIWSKKEVPASAKKLAVLSLIIFGIQAWLGRQTVIQLLKTEMVTSHLIGGYSLFAVNLLIAFRLKRSTFISETSPFKSLLLLLLLVSFGQAILGALVSSHYGGLACGSEFPTCNGSLIPKLDGIVAIHFVHRWNAIFLSVLLIMSWLLAKLSLIPPVISQTLKWACIFIGIQIILGIAMVFTTIHPGFSVLHSLFSLSIFTVLLRGVDHVHYR